MRAATHAIVEPTYGTGPGYEYDIVYPSIRLSILLGPISPEQKLHLGYVTDILIFRQKGQKSRSHMPVELSSRYRFGATLYPDN